MTSMDKSTQKPDLKETLQELPKQPDVNETVQDLPKQPDVNETVQELPKQPDLNEIVQECPEQPYLNEYYEYEKRYTKDNIIRTDFILKNAFGYLLENHYSFIITFDAMNKKEKDVLNYLKKLLDAFRNEYASPLKKRCAEITITSEDDVEPMLFAISDELFEDGINWSRILALFVFVGELCTFKKLSNSIVDIVYLCFSCIVKHKLERWIIESGGGWEGILNELVVQDNSIPTPSWKTYILDTIVQIFRWF